MTKTLQSMVSALAVAAFAVGALVLPAQAASAQAPVEHAPQTLLLEDGTSCGDHNHGDLYADPDDPGSFYQCSWGTAYLHKCPSILHFNPTLLVCDWPQDAGNPAADRV